MPIEFAVDSLVIGSSVSVGMLIGKRLIINLWKDAGLTEKKAEAMDNLDEMISILGRSWTMRKVHDPDNQFCISETS